MFKRNENTPAKNSPPPSPRASLSSGPEQQRTRSNAVSVQPQVNQASKNFSVEPHSRASAIALNSLYKSRSLVDMAKTSKAAPDQVGPKEAPVPETAKQPQRKTI